MSDTQVIETKIDVSDGKPVCEQCRHYVGYPENGKMVCGLTRTFGVDLVETRKDRCKGNWYQKPSEAKNGVISTTYTVSQETIAGISWFSVARTVRYIAFSKPKETINHGPFKTLELANARVEELKAQDAAFVKDYLAHNS